MALSPRRNDSVDGRPSLCISPRLALSAVALSAGLSVLLGGCGSSDSSPSSPSAGSRDSAKPAATAQTATPQACTLMTGGDVKQRLGGNVDTGKVSNDYFGQTCMYSDTGSPLGGTAGVSVSVQTETPDLFQRGRAEDLQSGYRENVVVPGAVADYRSGAATVVRFLKDNHVVNVQVSLDRSNDGPLVADDAGLRADMVALATVVASRV